MAQKERCKDVRENCAAMIARLEKQKENLRALNERLLSRAEGRKTEKES